MNVCECMLKSVTVNKIIEIDNAKVVTVLVVTVK